MPTNSELIEFKLDDGSTILVTGMTAGGMRDASLGAVVDRAEETFNKALERLKPVASALVETFKDIGPDGISVELGVKFSAKSGVILASADAEAALKVTLSWKK